MKAESPVVVMVKIALNRDGFEDVRDAFNIDKVSVARAAGIEQRHIERAEERGVNPMRFAQGSGGRNAPDSGTPIFGSQGQSIVSLYHVLEDLRQQLPHLKLVSKFVQKKDGPKGPKHTLVLVYDAPTAEKPEVTPDGAQRFHIQRLTRRIYNHLHVWRNPSDRGQTITINAGGGIDHVIGPNRDDKEPGGSKDLRIYEQGRSIRCVERS